MKKSESVARQECANYNVGKCSGVMFVRNESGKQIAQVLSKEHEGKDCFPVTIRSFFALFYCHF